MTCLLLNYTVPILNLWSQIKLSEFDHPLLQGYSLEFNGDLKSQNDKP